MGFLIRYEGIFNYRELYRFIHDWLEQRKYDVDETRYKAKGGESELEWTATKDVTEYVRNSISVKFHFWDVKHSSKDGREEDTGRFEIDLAYQIITKEHLLFQTKSTEGTTYGNIIAKLKTWMITLRKNEIAAEYEDKLHYETLRLQTEIKKLLNTYTATSAY
ncbi:MAG: hypothetical protein HC945_02545 [Nitrosarchaeum sp.]|nr:hypothetical protein [Nitrosarchaeum sp.]